MANHFRLFSRPLAIDDVNPALQIVGVLDGYSPGSAYESRLDILNSIGKCRVEVLESTLPNGSKVFVDNVTKEVVVAWPAFEPEQPAEHPIPNGSFESGDDGSWLIEQGWSYANGVGNSYYDGGWSMRFSNFTGTSEIRSLPIRATPGDNINLAMQVQQGASSPGNCGAAVFMRFRDANLTEVGYFQGNMVNRGAKGAWHESRTYNQAPAGTAWVEVGARAYRSRQNKPMWVDYFTWDHQYTLGQDTDEVYFLRIKVIDSLNREAFWSGTIEEVTLLFTSLLYPVFEQDSFSISAGTQGFNYSESPASNVEEYFGIVATPVGMTFGSPIITPLPSEDGFTITATPISMVYRDASIPVTKIEEQFFIISAAPQGMTHRSHPAYTESEIHGFVITATPQGMTYG